MSRIRKPSPALVVAVVALVAALGGVAVASPLGSGGKIQLCYSQSSLDDPGSGSSAVFVVNAGHPCDGDYPDALTINQTGPRGLPGPAGVPGPAGPRGPQGLPGGVKPLPDKLKDNSLGDLKKVDRSNDKTEDKLRELERRLEELMNRKGEVDPDALARQQQHAVQLITTLQQQLQQITDVNQSVIRKLAR